MATLLFSGKYFACICPEQLVANVFLSGADAVIDITQQHEPFFTCHSREGCDKVID